jgi:hypothetical protein
MAEEKTNANPFAGFNLLDGGFGTNVPDDEPEVNDDIIAGDPTIIDDEPVSELGTNAADADKLLEEVAKKQAAAKEKNKPVVVDDTTDDLEDTEEIVDEPQGAGFKPALTHLSDKGILEFNDTDIEDSEEGFEKAIDQTVKNKFEKLLTNKLGEDGLALLNFVENGGNPKHFIEAYYNDASWEDYSIDDNEAAQKIAVRESLRLAGEEAEDIEDMISEFTDNGTLEKRAKSALIKLQKFEATSKQELVEAQKAKAIQDKKAEEKYWNDFKSNILAKEEIKGFKLTPKVKENLVNFFTITDRTGKTGYQKAVESDTDAALLFGLQAMNNFDISKLEKQVMTKTASKLNSLMKNYQPNSKDKISSGRTDIQTEGTDPFAGFKKMQ